MKKTKAKRRLETNHSNVWAVAEAGFTDNRKIGALPTVGFVVSEQPVRHD